MSWLASMAAILLALAGLGRAAADTGAAASARPDTSLFPIAHFAPDTTIVADTSIIFTIEMGSRLYPEWKEVRRVHLFEPFPIGDTEFTAAVTRFLPDFRLFDGRPVCASRRLANPAIHVLTSRDTTFADSSWAFLNFPPHFSPRAFFTFQLKGVAGYTGDPDSAAVGEATEGNATKGKGRTPKQKGGTPE